MKSIFYSKFIYLILVILILIQLSDATECNQYTDTLTTGLCKTPENIFFVSMVEGNTSTPCLSDEKVLSMNISKRIDYLFTFYECKMKSIDVVYLQVGGCGENEIISKNQYTFNTDYTIIYNCLVNYNLKFSSNCDKNCSKSKVTLSKYCQYFNNTNNKSFSIWKNNKNNIKIDSVPSLGGYMDSYHHHYRDLYWKIPLMIFSILGSITLIIFLIYLIKRMGRGSDLESPLLPN